LHFAPDTEASLEFTVALANTVAGATKSGRDEISTADELAGFLRLHTFSGRIDRDDAELADVLVVRDEVRTLWSLPADDQVAAINAWFRDVAALPQLERHDKFDWHFHATSPDAPLADRMRAEGALALAEIVRFGQQDRMKVCAADDCTGILVDQSRNGSKRFCSVRCGNRVNQQGFRERMG